MKSDPGSDSENLNTAVSMANSLVHRGPDDSGVWSNNTGVALAHRRLSIQDTSTHGHQPMHSACGQYIVVFNGEIYNFLQLREELEQTGCMFSGHSDTEVLLACVTHWGLENALQRFNGMFALALWDKQTQTLFLARDKVGKKPLYFGWTTTGLVFASELKALRCHPSFDARISHSAVALYLRHNYIPAPHSIYDDVFKLMPGSFLTIKYTDIVQRTNLQHKVSTYWDPLATALACMEKPFEGTFDAATDKLESLLEASVQRRMICDVPLGILLSGGIDSTVVTAIAQSGSAIPLKTFSIGFDGEKNSEADAARRIAEHLGTSHTELILDGQAALDVIPKLHCINDEPMGDPSQIPTYLVSKLAGSAVTVALTGDGGDELFYGYKRYLSNAKIWQSGQKIPAALRSSLACLLDSVAHFQVSESKLCAHANTLRARHPLDVYTSRTAKFTHPEKLLQSHSRSKIDLSLSHHVRKLDLPDAESNMMLLDFTTYLVDDILVKVDRASMQEGLEMRNPLLDVTIIEYAWSLPQAYKFDGQRGKHVLRNVLARYVSDALTNRPKQGFSPPLKTWLHGPLCEWADSLLEPARLDREGVFDSKVVDNLWQSCKKNQGKGLSRIWTILMFQVWYEGNM